MNRGIKRGMVALFSANIINLVFNLLTNFLLPKYLSVDSYAAIKTFQLYSTYIGVFALGCSDGMYLRYGGKALEDVNRNELKSGMFSFRIIMLIESFILVPLALFHKDKIIIGFTLTIFTMNMVSYFKNLYQAVGEFKTYGRILNWITIATFMVNMVLLFLVHTDDYFLYIVLYAAVDAVVWIILEINMHKLMESQGAVHFSVRLITEDIKSGFLLMVGNFSNILLSSMDRWFVKAMMDSVQFAFYSFAVSMEGFLNVAITPITTTLYNYFCNHLDYENVVKIRKYVLLFGSIIAAAAFPAKFVIEVFLSDYIGAVSVLFVLFATQMVYIIIKGVYVNLYKARKRQNTYFFRLIVVLVIGAIFNYLFVQIYPRKEAFAYGTLASSLVWLAFSVMDFMEYKYELNECLYLGIEILIFILLGIKFSSIIGFVIYVLVTLAMMIVFMKKEVMSIISFGQSIIRK